MKNLKQYFLMPPLPPHGRSLAPALVTKIFEFRVSVKTYRDFI